MGTGFGFSSRVTIPLVGSAQDVLCSFRPFGTDQSENGSRGSTTTQLLSEWAWVSAAGARGVVDEFQAEKGRYVVEFANGSRKLIHGKNLKPSQDTCGGSPTHLLSDGASSNPVDRSSNPRRWLR